ncbi:MAG: hypothetical protein GY928_16970, partial [Colwellia sp.]|nr:hypothetical protein [Colwellia sp.]
MTEIIFYPHREVPLLGDEGTILSHIRRKALRKKKELFIASSIEYGFRVFASHNNSSIIIYENAEVVAEVNGFEIAIRNKYIKRSKNNWKNGGHWKQNGIILFSFNS